MSTAKSSRKLDAGCRENKRRRIYQDEPGSSSSTSFGIVEGIVKVDTKKENIFKAEPLESMGEAMMGFGVHGTQSRHWVLENDSAYCLWALGEKETTNERFRLFQDYIRRKSEGMR